MENNINKNSFTFVDLFSGIGGFRIPLEQLGGICIASCEIEKNARKIYYSNFGEYPDKDIREKNTENNIPKNIDILCAGFPCQPFSIVGKRKGLKDSRSDLLTDLFRIIKNQQPKSFILENVPGLITHNNGNTINYLLEYLQKYCGYYIIDPMVLNSKNFGVPQNRKRVFIVGFKNKPIKFTSPKKQPLNIVIKDILESKPIDSHFYLSQKYIDFLKFHKEKQKLIGNGFGYTILSLNGIANTLTKSPSCLDRNLIRENDSIRQLTPRECARLQGFPDSFKINVPKTVAYKLLGNSVCVPVIKFLAIEILKCLNYGKNNKYKTS